jgi:hypothetical protein
MHSSSSNSSSSSTFKMITTQILLQHPSHFTQPSRTLRTTLPTILRSRLIRSCSTIPALHLVGFLLLSLLQTHVHPIIFCFLFPVSFLLHVSFKPGQLSQTDLAHHQQQAAGIPFHSLNLMSPHQYQPPVYNTSPQHVAVPISGSPPPQSPNMYDPLSPPISGSDTSADGVFHHHHPQHPHHTHSRNSSITSSPSSSRGGSLVHRNSNPIRYNPTPSPTTTSSGRRRGRSFNDSDEDDMMGIEYTPNANNLAHTRKEATRRQRIEAEQRRRDELRDGYAKLKEVLPISNQKSSKVSLLERGTSLWFRQKSPFLLSDCKSDQSYHSNGQGEPGNASSS